MLAEGVTLAAPGGFSLCVGGRGGLAACAAAGSPAERRAAPRSTLSARSSSRPRLRRCTSRRRATERGRLYVVEQAGRIRVVENGRLRAAPFLDIRRLVRSGGEQGLLSVAFHPAYAANRRFFVNYTDRNGDTRVVEYRSKAGTRALTRAARQWLFVRQPYPNHNGGQLAFGPDGRLYVGMGDGGAGGDPENRAQNMGTLLGKLVADRRRRGRGRARRSRRSALRNPWRFSFDRANGDLWIGDVGQNAWEEIDFLPRSQLGELENYGWDVYEGRARVREQGARRAARWCSPIEVYAARRAARSRAGSSTAAPRCRPRAAATSTATTAAGSSGACARSTAARPTSGARRSASRACRRSARTRAASCTRRRSTARVYRLAP